MELKATGKLDFEAFRTVIHLQIGGKSDPRKRVRFYTIFSAALLAFIILEMIVFEADLSFWILLCCTVILGSSYCFRYFLLPRIKYAAAEGFKNAVNEYTFFDQKMKVSTKSEGYNSTAEIEYFFFMKVYETSKYFILQQKDRRAFLVDKETITGGTAEDIKNKLIPFVGKKYIVCNY